MSEESLLCVCGFWQHYHRDGFFENELYPLSGCRRFLPKDRA